MELTTTSFTPFEKISLDIVGPLTLTEDGNLFILTLQDDLTQFSQVYLKPNHGSKTIDNILILLQLYKRYCQIVQNLTN